MPTACGCPSRSSGPGGLAFLRSRYGQVSSVTCFLRGGRCAKRPASARTWRRLRGLGILHQCRVKSASSFRRLVTWARRGCGRLRSSSACVLAFRSDSMLTPSSGSTSPSPLTPPFRRGFHPRRTATSSWCCSGLDSARSCQRIGSHALTAPPICRALSTSSRPPWKRENRQEPQISWSIVGVLPARCPQQSPSAEARWSGKWTFWRNSGTAGFAPKTTAHFERTSGTPIQPSSPASSSTI